ncbi:MAG: AAA family ATPase, partial [Armatimonadetes bacterium]|nr:AAA family ATPase [Armatimonadota bacterium]
MLTHLHVQNFALMESLDLRPGPGLNILTGETGAGKSILIDALNAALGERTGTEAVRTGSDRALVEAVFDLSPCPSVVSRLAADGWLDEGETELVL